MGERRVQYLALRKWEKPKREAGRRPKYTPSRGICRKHKEQTHILLTKSYNAPHPVWVSAILPREEVEKSPLQRTDAALTSSLNVCVFIIALQRQRATVHPVNAKQIDKKLKPVELIQGK